MGNGGRRISNDTQVQIAEHRPGKEWPEIIAQLIDWAMWGTLSERPDYWEQIPEMIDAFAARCGFNTCISVPTRLR